MDILTLLLAKKMAGGGGGANGFSPVVNIEKITGGHRVTVVDAEGSHSFEIMDGQAPYIGDNGNWWVWDAETGGYVDTGQKGSGTADSITGDALIGSLTSMTDEEKTAIRELLGAKSADETEDGVVDFDGVAIDPTEDEEVIEF